MRSHKRTMVWALAMLMAAMLLSIPALAASVTLNLVNAGDQNMVEFFQNVLGPEFTKRYPDITVRVVGSGPGPAGSQTIVEKLRAQKEAGRAAWDVDVAVIHEIGAAWAMQDGLLQAYTDQIETSKYATSPAAKTSLGIDVEGYVMPMFHSQTAIAYNPAVVSDPPRSYDELVEWVKANPRKFGYNGIKNGASGIAFLAGWLYWKTGDYDRLAVTGPYDPSVQSSWEPVYEALNEFNRYVTITSGNAGTLDMLNRGEIAMGPVWVDMFYTWMAEGRLDPNLRLILLSPGMPGQPMYYTIPAGAAHPDAAMKFIEFATSPEIQAKFIVERFNWYPGIDANAVRPHVDPDTWQALFTDITPEDLAQYGKVFPLTEYYDDMLEAYERWVR